MKLTDSDKKIFETLHSSEVGKWLVDYLQRLSMDIFNPDEVTIDNINSRKDTIAVIKKELIDRIVLIHKSEPTKGNNHYY